MATTDTSKEVLIKIDADIKGLVTKIATGREELEKLKKKNDELKTSLSDLEKQGKKGSDQWKEVNREIILNEQAVKAQEKAIKSFQGALERSITANNSNEGSLQQLRAQLSAANNAWDKLDATTREFSTEGKVLQEAIAGINAKLLEQEGLTGRNQRNVGNYKSALEGVKEKLFELQNLKADINKSGFDSAKQSIDKVNDSINTLVSQSQANFDKIQAELIATGKAAIDQATTVKELTGLVNAYTAASRTASGQAAEAFKQLAVEARKSADDIKDELKNLASDTSTFDAISQGINVVVSSFGAFQGAAALFGKDNEELEESLKKTQAALLLVNSVTSITNALQKEKSLVTKGLAAATTIWNFALLASDKVMKALRISTIATTAVTNGFRTALAATGIGAIIVLIGLLIANFDKVVNTIKSVTGALSGFTSRFQSIGAALQPFIFVIEGIFAGLKKLGQLIGIIDSDEASRIKSNMKLQEDQMKSIERTYDLQSKLATAAGKDTRKIEEDKLKAQNDNIQAQIENLLRLEKENGKFTEDQKEKLTELKEAWRKNFEDILVSQVEYNTQQAELSEQSELALLNIELRKQSLLGGNTTAKKLQIAKQEYDIAIETARKKGEDTSVIEAEYEQKIFEIKNEAANRRKELDFKIREASIALLNEGLTKEIEAERLALDQKLNSIRGNSEQENNLRALYREQSQKKLEDINKKYSQIELDKLIEAQKKKLDLETQTTQAIDNAQILSAQTKAERFAAELKLLNDTAAAEIAQRENDKLKELSLQDQATEKELEALRGKNEFRSASLQEQQELENGIIESGLKTRELINQKYDALELETLAKHANDTKELTKTFNQELNEERQAQLDIAIEVNQGNFAKELELQLEQIGLQEQAELNAKQHTEETKTLIHHKYAKQRELVTAQSEQTQLGLISNGLTQVQGLFKKGSEAYKVLAVGQAYIDTFRGATAALAPPPTGAGPVFGPILAGITIATGLANVHKIATTNTGFKDGGLYSSESGYTGNIPVTSVSTNLGIKPYTYHGQEYIFSQPMLQDPVISTFVQNVAEPLRRNKLRGQVSRSSFASGGYAPPVTTGPGPIFITQTVSPADMEAAMTAAISKMPPPVATIEDINAGLQRVSIVDSRANL